MSVALYLYKPRMDLAYGDYNNEEGWSDGQYHDNIDVSYYNAIYHGDKCWKKYRKKLEFFNPHITKVHGNIYKYIPVDIVKYARGWFLKNSFFRKKCTTIICTSKKEIELFFKRYVKLDGKCMDIYCSCLDLYNIFMNSWEDGMIFMCNW